MRGKQPTSADIADEIVRIISQDTSKCLHGSEWEVIGMLRDRGALTTLDRGLKRGDRHERRAAKQDKFALLKAALSEAVTQGRIVFAEYDGGVAYAMPLQVPATFTTPAATPATQEEANDHDGPLITRMSGTMRVNLNRWAWRELTA